MQNGNHALGEGEQPQGPALLAVITVGQINQRGNVIEKSNYYALWRFQPCSSTGRSDLRGVINPERSAVLP